ncbi:MAG: hypothetical protein ACR5KV_08710 [Wolbachia sp.]
MKEIYAKENSSGHPSINTSSSGELLSQDKRPLDTENTQIKRRKTDNQQVNSYLMMSMLVLVVSKSICLSIHHINQQNIIFGRFLLALSLKHKLRS